MLYICRAVHFYLYLKKLGSLFINAPNKLCWPQQDSSWCSFVVARGHHLSPTWLWVGYFMGPFPTTDNPWYADKMSHPRLAESNIGGKIAWYKPTLKIGGKDWSLPIIVGVTWFPERSKPRDMIQTVSVQMGSRWSRKAGNKRFGN